MEKFIYLNSQYIKGNIPLDNLNLDNLPDFPVLDEIDKTIHIGYVHYYNKDKGFAFIVINGQDCDENGENKTKEVFLHKSNWMGDVEITIGLLVTFNICKQGNNKEKAVNVKPFDRSVAKI